PFCSATWPGVVSFLVASSNRSSSTWDVSCVNSPATARKSRRTEEGSLAGMTVKLLTRKTGGATSFRVRVDCGELLEHRLHARPVGDQVANRGESHLPELVDDVRGRPGQIGANSQLLHGAQLHVKHQRKRWLSGGPLATQGLAQVGQRAAVG